MSQYKWFTTEPTTGKPLLFLAGWDEPLRYFFLVIDYEDDADGPVFSNLALSNPAMTLEQIDSVCRAHGSLLPPDIRQLMIEDQKRALH